MKTEVIYVRVERAMKSRIEKLAKDSGYSNVSEYIRMLIAIELRQMEFHADLDAMLDDEARKAGM